MFHQGDVQSGITVALQNGKSVVCFVTDSGEESQLWEESWLQDQNLPQKLGDKAIALKIEQGSHEAQQLSAVYSINEAPTVLIINQGRLDAQIRRGASKNEFSLSILKGLHPSIGHSNPPSNGSSASQLSTGSSVPTASSAQASSASTAPSADVTSETPRSTAVSATVNDATSRIITNGSATVPLPGPPSPASSTTRSPPQSAEPSSTSQTTGSAWNTPLAPTPTLGSTQSPQQETYVQRQARFKKEANQERERVRALIEADKQARKAKQMEQRKQAQDIAAQQLQAVGPISEKTGSESRSRQPHSECALSIRLLDGSTIRRRFGADTTLSSDVRPWIDAQRRDETMPYTLKVILTPRPSRALEPVEEKDTLADLSLVPSASLVLVPVQNFTTAYRTNGELIIVLHPHITDVCFMIASGLMVSFGFWIEPQRVSVVLMYHKQGLRDSWPVRRRSYTAI